MFRGSNCLYAGLAVLVALLIGFQLRISEMKYEIRRNEKEYALVLDELDKNNNYVLNGE